MSQWNVFELVAPKEWCTVWSFILVTPAGPALKLRPEFQQCIFTRISIKSDNSAIPFVFSVQYQRICDVYASSFGDEMWLRYANFIMQMIHSTSIRVPIQNPHTHTQAKTCLFLFPRSFHRKRNWKERKGKERKREKKRIPFRLVTRRLDSLIYIEFHSVCMCALCIKSIQFEQRAKF